MIETGFLSAGDTPEHHHHVADMAVPAGALGMLCPQCGQPGVTKEGACLNCHQCGWSKCG